MRQIKGEKMRKPMSYSDLSVKNGLIMKGKHIIIPETLQQEVLEQLHRGHQGMVKCKERARVSVWWPKINKDIEEFVRKCSICCQFKDQNTSHYVSQSYHHIHGRK